MTRSLKAIQTELYTKRCLKLYNDRDSSLNKKRKRGRGWIKLQVEAAEERYAKRMNEFKLELYLDLTIKSIPNAIWVQTRDQYLITLKVEREQYVDVETETVVERDMLIDLRRKRLLEIARQMKSHHSSYMMIVSKDEDELIIYKAK